MKLPRFWAKEEGEATAPTGEPLHLAVWRWSQESLEHARKEAADALKRFQQRVASGQPVGSHGYLYATRPAREEILRELVDGSGKLVAAITRNSYGCQVLNAANVMFVDSDYQPSAFGWLKKLFGKQTADPALARAEELVAHDPRANVRIYRTNAGVRFLLTHELFDPCSEQTREIMKRLGADPKYSQLCRVQECFRARLTPKPWRCGVYRATHRWPWADDQVEREMHDWIERYEAACRGKVVCQLVDAVGSGVVHPEAESIVKLHDAIAGVDSSGELA